jgi:hypothetical protein
MSEYAVSVLLESSDTVESEGWQMKQHKFGHTGSHTDEIDMVVAYSYLPT